MEKEMTVGHFQSRFALDDPVLVLGSPAVVFGVRFVKDAVLYDVRFVSGGAVGLHDSSEVIACP